MAIPPDRAYNVLEYLVFRNADTKSREKIRSELDMPLAGEDPDEVEEGVWSEEGQAAAFDAAADEVQ